MKILHTSDWHLGKKLQNFDRINEQKEVAEEICKIADENDVDVVIISGDLFDNVNPSEEARNLFYKTVKKLCANGRRIVIAIAGNHDSPEGIESPDPLAKEFGILLVGFPNTKIGNFETESAKVEEKETGIIEIKFQKFQYPLRILLSPYTNEYRLKKYLNVNDNDNEIKKILVNRWKELAEKYCDNNGVNLLVAHALIMENGNELPEPEDEKPIIGGIGAISPEDIPNNIHYVALGHLHKMQVIKDKIVYSGCPIAYSFSEANQEKYVIIIDAMPGNLTFKKVQLHSGKRLLRCKFENMFEAINFLKNNQDALIELTMVVENSLTPEQIKILHNAHPHIINIIPELKNKEKISQNKIMLDDNIENLFIQYYKQKFSQNPNPEIIELFREVLSVEEK